MKTALIFPGHGSQFVGMGKEIYDNSRLVQEYFEEASCCLNINFVRLCFASSEYELKKTTNAHVALFLINVSFAAFIKQMGISVDALVGFGMGHYGALCASGALSFPDGLYLLNKFAHLYHHAPRQPSVRAFYVYGIATEDLRAWCNKVSTATEAAHISVFWESQQAVVCGTPRAVAMLRDDINAAGGRMKRYPFEANLYSPFMNPVVTDLKMYLEKIDLSGSSIPLIYNGRLLKCEPQKHRLLNYLNEPIFWDKDVHFLRGFDRLITIGFCPAIIDNLKQLYPTKQISSLGKCKDLVTLKQHLVKRTAVIQTTVDRKFVHAQ